VALDPPRFDFLLPQASWERGPAQNTDADAEHAGWLIAIFDLWLADGRPIKIRTLDSVVSTLRGRGSRPRPSGWDRPAPR
jgi:uncharacterized protein